MRTRTTLTAMTVVAAVMFGWRGPLEKLTPTAIAQDHREDLLPSKDGGKLVGRFATTLRAGPPAAMKS